MGGLLKISLALIGATGAAGSGILVHKLMNKDIISKHINPKVLLTPEHTDKWSHRLNLLKGAIDTELSKDLLSKKKQSSLTIEDLKSWCSTSLRSEFINKEDKKFENVRLYCGLNMGDNIQGTKVSSNTTGDNANLKANFGKLKIKTSSELVSKLFSIKDTDNTNSPWNGSIALRDWCVKAFNTPFEEGLIYSNIKEYCILN